MSALFQNISSLGSSIFSGSGSATLSITNPTPVPEPTLPLDGSTSAQAAPSATYIKNLTGTNTNGIYWINLPTVGATQTYCIMDSAVAGGGWMLALKATRGTTFPYSSTHWTSVTTLNPSTGLNRSDGDAKFDCMNYFPANDFMALWPDIPYNYGSSTKGGDLWLTGEQKWCWLAPNINGGTAITPINFFNTVGNISLSADPRNSAAVGTVFSTQVGNQFYGFNFYQTNPQYTDLKARWGFGWNNEADWLSNDVTGGIGLSWRWDVQNSSYSAGDWIGCCASQTGINRSARVEYYIRSTISTLDGSTSARAAPSAMYIKYLTGTQTNGVYWINLPTVGATQVYCLMDSKWAGGGWMMLMKATRGTTFTFNSNYWTTTNTLNPSTGLNRNDGDAKFDSFNYYPCLDVLALWPDLTASTGGSIAQTENWSWYVPNYYNKTSNGRATGIIGFGAAGSRDVPGYSNPLTYPGFNSAYWSQQPGAQRFVFGGGSHISSDALARWGFLFNNEGDFASVDASGGVGLQQGQYWSSSLAYSSGDWYGCCGTAGLNRSMRVELYGR
jgi:hypothetical protein